MSITREVAVRRAAFAILLAIAFTKHIAAKEAGAGNYHQRDNPDNSFPHHAMFLLELIADCRLQITNIKSEKIVYCVVFFGGCAAEKHNTACPLLFQN